LAGSCTVPATSPCDITDLLRARTTWRRGRSTVETRRTCRCTSTRRRTRWWRVYPHRPRYTRPRSRVGWRVTFTVSVQSGVCTTRRLDQCRRSVAGSCTTPASTPCEHHRSGCRVVQRGRVPADSGDPTQVSTSVPAAETRCGPASARRRCQRHGDRRWGNVAWTVSGQVGVAYHAEGAHPRGSTLADSCTVPATSPCDITGWRPGHTTSGVRGRKRRQCHKSVTSTDRQPGQVVPLVGGPTRYTPRRRRGIHVTFTVPVRPG